MWKKKGRVSRCSIFSVQPTFDFKASGGFLSLLSSDTAPMRMEMCHCNCFSFACLAVSSYDAFGFVCSVVLVISIRKSKADSVAIAPRQRRASEDKDKATVSVKRRHLKIALVLLHIKTLLLPIQQFSRECAWMGVRGSMWSLSAGSRRPHLNNHAAYLTPALTSKIQPQS